MIKSLFDWKTFVSLCVCSFANLIFTSPFTYVFLECLLNWLLSLLIMTSFSEEWRCISWGTSRAVTIYSMQPLLIKVQMIYTYSTPSWILHALETRVLAIYFWVSSNQMVLLLEQHSAVFQDRGIQKGGNGIVHVWRDVQCGKGDWQRHCFGPGNWNNG